jgi:hypothetical protein
MKPGCVAEGEAHRNKFLCDARDFVVWAHMRPLKRDLIYVCAETHLLEGTASKPLDVSISNPRWVMLLLGERLDFL